LPLANQTLFLVGRLQGLTRRRLETLLRVRGARLATRPGNRVTMIAFGHSAVGQALDDGRVALPTGLPAAAALISENVLRRALGLLEPPADVDRSMGRAEIERLAGLTPNPSPAWYCSTYWSRSTSASPIATWWRRARRRAS
jgi:hypothetical protein